MSHTPVHACDYCNQTLPVNDIYYDRHGKHGHRECVTMNAPLEYTFAPQMVETRVRRTTHMTKDEFANFLETTIHPAEIAVRKVGQAEYAHASDNCFDNFDRLSYQLQLSRQQILWVYAQKHLDGIVAHINGHTSQREDVRGRIKDARMYLALLWAMVEVDTPTP